jgi:uncharacterized protein with GYD domain
MPTYVLMGVLMDEGRKTVEERPDRIKEVNKELESMGARVRWSRVRAGIDRMTEHFCCRKERCHDVLSCRI